MLSLLLCFLTGLSMGADTHRPRQQKTHDITIYIDEGFIKDLTGFPMEIFAILNGNVLDYILDPNFEKYLPVIPAEVGYVNFTWSSGEKHNYYYDFDELKSFNASLLQDPLLSIATKGKVPRSFHVFQVFLNCLNTSGIASFSIGLRIRNDKGLYLKGTPLRLQLQKQCSDHLHGPDPECDQKCRNGGRCNNHKTCECAKGFVGKYCESALCYPKCLNSGTCIAPGVCSCLKGFIGTHCEGGLCSRKCLNGGKCIQKDTCLCRRGYYGMRCEYSACSIPCLNGRCIGLNICKCKRGYSGNQCEAASLNMAVTEGCKKKCINGYCENKRCICDKGWFGKRCNRRKQKKRRQRKLYQ